MILERECFGIRFALSRLILVSQPASALQPAFPCVPGGCLSPLLNGGGKPADEFLSLDLLCIFARQPQIRPPVHGWLDVGNLINHFFPFSPKGKQVECYLGGKMTCLPAAAAAQDGANTTAPLRLAPLRVSHRPQRGRPFLHENACRGGVNWGTVSSRGRKPAPLKLRRQNSNLGAALAR